MRNFDKMLIFRVPFNGAWYIRTWRADGTDTMPVKMPRTWRVTQGLVLRGQP